MDSSPSETERAARKNQIDLALSFDDILLGENWVKKEIAQVNWHYYARKNHPLAKKKKLDTLSQYPLIGFCHLHNEQLILDNGHLQTQLSAINGHKSENSRYTTNILSYSDSIAYLPDIAVAQSKKDIVKLKIENPAVKQNTKNLFIHFNVDSFTKRNMDEIVKYCRQAKF